MWRKCLQKLLPIECQQQKSMRSMFLSYGQLWRRKEEPNDVIQPDPIVRTVQSQYQPIVVGTGRTGKTDQIYQRNSIQHYHHCRQSRTPTTTRSLFTTSLRKKTTWFIRKMKSNSSILSSNSNTKSRKRSMKISKTKSSSCSRSSKRNRKKYKSCKKTSISNIKSSKKSTRISKSWTKKTKP